MFTSLMINKQATAAIVGRRLFLVKNNYSASFFKRGLLTPSYFCYEEWDKYLQNDVIKKVGNINNLSYELDSKLTNKVLVTPLDMDMLATKIVFLEQFSQLEFIESIFAKYRKTQSALYVRNSMHYGFVRSYLDLSQGDRLLQILKLKYKYGIFVDEYSANMLMDYYLKKNDFKKAAIASHEVMLQEMNQNELTLAYSLFSCIKYISELKKNNDANELEEFESEQTPGEGKEEGQKQKLLVFFLRNKYDDEHFDLKSLKKLSGKTIYFASSQAKSADKLLKTSLKIYGLVLFGKLDKALDMIEKHLIESKEKCYDFVIDELKVVVEKLTTTPPASENNESQTTATSNSKEKLIERWGKLYQLIEKDLKKNWVPQESMLKDLEAYLTKLEKAQIDKDAKAQKALMTKWEAELKVEHETQLRNFHIEERRKYILNKLDELERREEVLTYFDNEQLILNTYYLKGFPEESPKDIPIEPEQTEFNRKYEGHFKPWPKYMNRPPSSLKPSDEEIYAIESLRKIYLNNEKAQTSTQFKLKTKSATA